MPTAEDDAITEILASAKTVSVVGLSPKPYRASYGVSETLQASGYRIFPVNPQVKEVLGEKCYARLEDIREKIDIVDIFGARNSCRTSSTRPSALAPARSGCR